MRKPDWSKQSERMWQFLLRHHNTEFSQPKLNAVAAGDGVYVNSFTKRVSEVRRRAQTVGLDLKKTRDEWHNGKRETGYTLFVP